MPGSPGEIWDFASQLGINNAGTIAFRGSANGRAGIWIGTSSTDLYSPVRSGDSAPGAPGLTFGRGFAGVTINGAGEIAFRNIPDGGSDAGYGIWIADADGTVRPIAVPGATSPGTSGVFASAGEPVLNARGQIAFTASLSGPGVHSGNDSGIWATDDRGLLQLIAREGSPLMAGEGDVTNLGTITDLFFRGGSGNQDGRASGFNDFGHVAFWAQVGGTTINSGAFVSNLVAVPEPMTATLSIAAWSISAWRPIRKRVRRDTEKRLVRRNS